MLQKLKKKQSCISGERNVVTEPNLRVCLKVITFRYFAAMKEILHDSFRGKSIGEVPTEYPVRISTYTPLT